MTWTETIQPLPTETMRLDNDCPLFHSAASEEGRYCMHGIEVSRTAAGDLRLAATNGRQLVTVLATHEEGENYDPADADAVGFFALPVVLDARAIKAAWGPKSTVARFLRVTGTDQCEVWSLHCSLRSGQESVTAIPQLSGDFPDVDAVKDGATGAGVDVILNMSELAKLLKSIQGDSVRFHFAGLTALKAGTLSKENTYDQAVAITPRFLTGVGGGEVSASSVEGLLMPMTR